jgi:hypothetical protein
MVVPMKSPTGRYDNDKMNVVEDALNLACKELCISKSDQVSRKRVASMVLAFAKYGHLDVEKLKTFAVQQF